jgi:hypothetical protein
MARNKQTATKNEKIKEQFSSDSEVSEVSSISSESSIEEESKKEETTPIADSSDSSEESSESESQEPETCPAIFKSGAKKGEVCGAKIKEDTGFCGRHQPKEAKASKTSPKESDEGTEEVEKRMGEMASAIAKKFNLEAFEVAKVMDAYMHKKENSKTDIAGQFSSPKSPKSSDKSASKSHDSSADSSETKVKRNKDLKVWYIEDTNIVVKSPRNKGVIGYINRKGEITEKLTPMIKKKMEEMGLEKLEQ